MIAVKQKKNLNVGSCDFQSFIRFAVSRGRAGGFHFNRARSQFLRDENGESLFASLGPIVNAREHRVLMVKIVVQNGDEWRVEREVLLEGMRALHLESDAGNASEPVTLLEAPWGGLISAVPLASQPPPEGVISKSSCPTVWPASLMVN